MTYREWKAALTKSQTFLKEEQSIANVIVADLDRKIENKKAELDRLEQKQKLNLREFDLDKREAMLVIEAKNVGYIEKLQTRIKELENNLEHSRGQFTSWANFHINSEKCGLKSGN